EGLAVMAVAGLFLHRHPRPVTHLLAGAGEGVEQGRFAAVGVADEGQGKGAVHSSSTSMAPASWRRRLRWKPRTRICTGSPRGARCWTSNSVPGVRPRAISRLRYRVSRVW